MASKKMTATNKERGDLDEGRDLGGGRDSGGGRDLSGGPDLAVRMPLFAEIVGNPLAPISKATGADIVRIATAHVGEPYVLGARAPMSNSGWKGPWDCAEFVSWCVYQASGILFGTEPRNNPVLADAYTGYWASQAQKGSYTISVEEAALIQGAAVLRIPHTGAIGHIVISDGKGGTLEAHSHKTGVIRSTLSDRRWDFGVLVPGIQYLRADEAVQLTVPDTNAILRLTQPLTQGRFVLAVQKALDAKGEPVGTIDGVYGPQTAHAVANFQAKAGLVVDGEVGPKTWEALGIPKKLRPGKGA